MPRGHLEQRIGIEKWYDGGVRRSGERRARRVRRVRHRGGTRASSTAPGNANRAPIRSRIRKKPVRKRWSAQSNKWERSETVEDKAGNSLPNYQLTIS